MEKELTKCVKRLMDPIIKIADLLRLEVKYENGKVNGEELIKVVNKYLVRDINNRDVFLPACVRSVFEVLNQLDYDLALIFNSLNEIDEKQRHIFYLIHFKKMTEQEIAKKNKTNQSNVNRAKRRAYFQLNERLVLNKWYKDSNKQE